MKILEVIGWSIITMLMVAGEILALMGWINNGSAIYTIEMIPMVALSILALTYTIKEYNDQPDKTSRSK